MKERLESLINKFDNSNMFEVLVNYPNQFNESFVISETINNEIIDFNFNRVIFLGMGGSAISGEIISNLLYELNSGIEVIVNRNYYYNGRIDENTLIIVSSYSGNTEETLTALNSLLTKTKNIVSVSTGGKLKDISKANNLSFVELPGGLQPRCALLYSLFVNLSIVLKSEFISAENKSIIANSIDEIKSSISKWTKQFSIFEENNKALKLADSLLNKTAVIYSSSRLSAVNLRWRGQIQENAKVPAFGNIIPEMNHNEINAWDSDSFKNSFKVFIMEDGDEYDRTKKRMVYLKELIGNNVDAETIDLSSKTYFARILELIVLGDWVSFYLALLLEKDPTVIPLITELKEKLS